MNISILVKSSKEYSYQDLTNKKWSLWAKNKETALSNPVNKHCDITDLPSEVYNNPIKFLNHKIKSFSGKGRSIEWVKVEGKQYSLSSLRQHYPEWFL